MIVSVQHYSEKPIHAERKIRTQISVNIEKFQQPPNGKKNINSIHRCKVSVCCFNRFLLMCIGSIYCGQLFVTIIIIVIISLCRNINGGIFTFLLFDFAFFVVFSHGKINNNIELSRNDNIVWTQYFSLRCIQSRIELNVWFLFFFSVCI